MEEIDIRDIESKINLSRIRASLVHHLILSDETHCCLR